MNRRFHRTALCTLLALATTLPARAMDRPAPATGSGPGAGDDRSSAPAHSVPPAPPPVAAKEERPRSCGETLLRVMGIGAAAGLTVGLINGHDELEATLLGAASPILAGLTLAMLASAGPRFLRPEEARPADLYLLGAPLRGKPREFLPWALGGAALAVAADRDGSGNRSGRVMLRYVVRW